MISGRRSHRILGCPICGFRVDPTDKVCPRCGSEFYEGTKFECPLCGGLVSSTDRACPSCHVDYTDFKEKTIARGSDDDIDALLTEIIDIESNQVKKEDKRFSCPECGWMLDGSESTCPRCNHDLVTDLSFQCPVCGGVVTSRTKICPECGARFEEPEQEAASSYAEPPKVERKVEAAVEFLRGADRTSAPSPPLEPIRVVRPAVIASPQADKEPAELAATATERPEEPPEQQPSIVEPERTRTRTVAEEPEETAQKEKDEVAPEEKTSVAATPSKRAAKRRKLKAKP